MRIYKNKYSPFLSLALSRDPLSGTVSKGDYIAFTIHSKVMEFFMKQNLQNCIDTLEIQCF